MLKLFLSLLLVYVTAYTKKAGQCVDDPEAIFKAMGGDLEQNILAGFSIEEKSYKANTPVKITLEGDGEFKGLLLYARLVVNGSFMNAHVGQFTKIPDKFQTLDEDCAKFGHEKSTVSHTENTYTFPQIFEWTPAKDFGNVEIRGMIVTEKTKWMQLNFVPLSNSGQLQSSNTTNSTAGIDKSGSSQSAPLANYGLTLTAVGTGLAVYFL